MGVITVCAGTGIHTQLFYVSQRTCVYPIQQANSQTHLKRKQKQINAEMSTHDKST